MKCIYCDSTHVYVTDRRPVQNDDLIMAKGSLVAGRYLRDVRGDTSLYSWECPDCHEKWDTIPEIPMDGPATPKEVIKAVEAKLDKIREAHRQIKLENRKLRKRAKRWKESAKWRRTLNQLTADHADRIEEHGWEREKEYSRQINILMDEIEFIQQTLEDQDLVHYEEEGAVIYWGYPPEYRDPNQLSLFEENHNG